MPEDIFPKRLNVHLHGIAITWGWCTSVTCRVNALALINSVEW
jgi:hypothetical protein